jgi:benzoyl-CoA reductase/2-hydroxyglutaryl-CoA dehydratase subunit BcrC/BadD/HgdB
MPKSEALKELKVILPYIRTRKANLKSLSPRLMIISDMLDHPGYLDLVEATGSVVVMDDMDLGSRYVYLPPANGEEDPFLSLATRYLKRHGSARMATWGEQADQIIAWVNEFKVDGILGLPLAWCYPHQYRIPYLVFRFDQSGIPNIFIDREYHLSNVGQLRTRIGAFIESLMKEGKKWT